MSTRAQGSGCLSGVGSSLTTLALALAPLGLVGQCMHLKWTSIGGTDDVKVLDVKDIYGMHWVAVGVAYNIFQLSLPAHQERPQTPRSLCSVPMLLMPRTGPARVWQLTGIKFPLGKSQHFNSCLQFLFLNVFLKGMGFLFQNSYKESWVI